MDTTTEHDSSNDTRILSAADIMAANDLTPEPVFIPEWNGTVLFRPMPADDAIAFQEAMNGPARKSAWVDIFAKCAVDADGNRLFQKNQVAELRKKNTKVFLRMQMFLMELNGFKQPDKSWPTVQRILNDAGVEAAVIQRVSELWKADTEADPKSVGNAAKND